MVNVHISDLFFNSAHEYQKQTPKLPTKEQCRQGFVGIHTEANEFLASLRALHVEDTPSVESLIEDFFHRL